MATDNKIDLLREIEAFSGALYEYRNICEDLVSEKEYNPYYSESGNLKRMDYDDVIKDENAFLAFYSVFFDSIKLNSNAENISDSEYFNTLYHEYKIKHKKETSNFDPFMQIIRNIDEKESLSIQEDEERYTVVEKFLRQILKQKIRENIKSKALEGRSLVQIALKEERDRADRTIAFVLSFVSLMFALIEWIFVSQSLSIIFATVSVVLLLAYTIVHFTVNKLRKLEKEELKQLSENFKKYLLGNRVTFNEEFFSDKTTSYLGPLLKDSYIYPYVKAKYTRIESENSITNE